jgi:hypothetical protein
MKSFECPMDAHFLKLYKLNNLLHQCSLYKTKVMAPIKNEVWVEGVGIVCNHIQCQLQVFLELPITHPSSCCHIQ